MSIEKFKLIRQNFVIENQDILVIKMSGIKFLMLKLLQRKSYFQLLILTKLFKALVNSSQIIKGR